MSDAAKAFTYGIALGAGTMFLLDPRQGGRRRALILDKAKRAMHEIEDAAEVGARDLAHRARGAMAEITHAEEPAADRALVERVRAALGRVCSHAHSIEVTGLGGGCVELKGPIVASEVGDVLERVSRVRGVQAIDNDLEIHETADISALQGGAPRRRRRNRTTPALKLLFGGAAAAVGLASLAAGSPIGLLLGGGLTLAIARTVRPPQPVRVELRRGANGATGRGRKEWADTPSPA
jgi:hypothetical protein